MNPHLLLDVVWWFLAWVALSVPTALVLGACIAAAERRDTDTDADTDLIVLPEAWR